MAFITVETKVPEVGRSLTTRLYYPTDLPSDVGNEVKGVITLLHGYTGTGQDWMMMTAACRYAADNGYILIAPDADNSFYLDMAVGPPWYTIITQLLPKQLHSIFKIPTEREKNFIAGLSMGGYGALRIGLSNPDKYAAVASFSGALDLNEMAEAGKSIPQIAPLLLPVLGPNFIVPEEADLNLMLKSTAKLPKEKQPRIFATCGLKDHGMAQIYRQNQAFRKTAEALPLDFTYREWEGVHEWNFWDRSLAEFIGFIQGSSYADKKRADWAAPMNNS